MNLAPDEQRVLAAVETVLGPLVAEGRASLDGSPAADIHGALIEITPTRESACPVTIRCEGPGDLDLFVGRYKITTHISTSSQRRPSTAGSSEKRLLVCHAELHEQHV
jgi:hypothetical protein